MATRAALPWALQRRALEAQVAIVAKQQLKPAGGLGRFSVLAMVLTLLGVALCAGLLYLQVVQKANETHNKEIADKHADALAALIDSRYRELRSQLTLLAGTPDVVNALGGEDKAIRDRLASRLLGNLAQARRIELIPRGEANVDLSADTPINFAALDLIRRAERSAFVGPEASANPRDILYAAAPVTDAEGVLGVLFVALSANYLNDPLSGFNDQLGLMQIEQSVDKAAPAIVLEYGEGTQALVVTRKALQAPGWELLFSGKAQSSVVSLASIGLPIAAALALGLGGIWLAFSRLTQVLKEDSSALAEYGGKVLTGHAGKTDHFQIDTFQSLAKRLAKSLGETSNTRRAGRQGVAGAVRADASNELTTEDGVAEGGAAAKNSKEAPPPLDDLLEDIEQSAQEGLPEVADQQNSAPAQSGKKGETLANKLAGNTPSDDADDLDDFLDIGDDDLGNALQTASDDDNFGMQVDEVDNSFPTIEFDAGIFRAYDIRGIVDTNLTPEVVYWIGRAFSAQARSEGQTRTVVGRDGRLSSPALAQELIRGLLEGGMDVVDIGQVATPMLYYATHTLLTGTGIMITGSHNPPEYNGLKMMIGGETLAESRITALHQRLLDNQLDHDALEGELSAVVIDSEYIDRILDDVAIAQPLKIVVDCGNGVAGGVAPLLLQELGCEVIPLYCEVDGTFPNHHPDPADPRNMQDLITVVKAENADAGIAFDGDGDRIGVVTNKGTIIWPDKLMMLFARDIVGRNPGADIIYDVKCSRHLNNLIAEYGGRPIMWKTGHSHMKAKLKETGALLAGEFSGHIAFGERWYGFDDALYTAARLLEIVGGDTASMSDIFDEFPATQSTPELKIATTEEGKFKIIEKLAASADFKDGTVTSIDGVRVDYIHAWGLIRASNTSPVLTLRFEADTVSDLDQVQNIFRTELSKINSKLTF